MSATHNYYVVNLQFIVSTNHKQAVTLPTEKNYDRLRFIFKMACLDWNETKSILHELESLFSRNDDIQDIEDIKKMSSEIEYQRSQHIRDAKDTIKR